MRSGLSTILQTLTPEAASVLNNSIAEAGRRNHGQTTPLHVAATLLAAPTGFLRQACIRSHPNSSHPLQCRALELCFSVALERLPTSTASPAATEPPVSNALTAALKRAQAHQRRGCPEQQQQPLLAVKVELEQLIISILDDPSVSRVMREASFSSPAVKATIEQSLNATVPAGNHLNQFGFRPSSPSPATHRNLYLNPRLQQQGISCINQPGHQRNDDVQKVMDIMSKSKKKNPILVGESEPEAIRKEILRRIEKGELATESELRNAQVISIEKEFESVSDKSQIPAKIRELGDLFEARIDTRCIVIDVSDLKWVVEQPPTAASDVGRESVAEMAKLVAKFAAESRKLWLIGTATCETYLRCQIYHPSMEIDWDLQALPIASPSRSPLFPRMETNWILGSSVESLNPLKNLTTTVARPTPFCPKCSGDYEHELVKLNHEFEAKSNLPRWMLNAKSPKTDQSQVKEQEQEQELDSVLRERIQELKRKWSDTCSRVHPSYRRSPIFDRMEMTVLPMTGLYKPNKGREPRLQPARTVHEALRSNPNQETSQKRSSESHVTTDLALGPKEVPAKSNEELTVKDLLGCISSEPEAAAKGKFVNAADADSFKRLLKGLMRMAWWQPEAAAAIATAVTRCRSGGGSRGSVWLLFAGPDRVGKEKMACVLADHVCGGGCDPVTISLGSRRGGGHGGSESDLGFRGKTVLDRIVEAVRRNPSSVIVLADVDEADALVRASVKRAMERGRLTDSHGREVSLGNVTFVLTGDWSTAHPPDEHRLHTAAAAADVSQLRLTVVEKTLKRRPGWLPDHDFSSTKQRKKMGLSLDLNLAVDTEEDRADGSDLTIEHEDMHGLENHQNFAVTSVPRELVGPSDGAIVFKPVHFGLVRREIERTIKNAFSTVVDDDEKLLMEVEEAAVENLLGGLWFGKTGLEEWAEDVLIPSLRELKARLRLPSPGGGDVVVRLEPDRDSGPVSGGGGGLPGKIAVVMDGV